jgi:hypothetical protein
VKVEAPFTPVNVIDVRPVEQDMVSCARVWSMISFAVLAAEPVVPFLNEPAVVVPVPPRVAVSGVERLTVVLPGWNLVGAAFPPVEVYVVVMVPAGSPVVCSVVQLVPMGAMTTLDPLAALMVTPFWVRPFEATSLLAVVWMVNLIGTVEAVRVIAGEMVMEPVMFPLSVPAKTTGVMTAPLGPLPATMTAAAGKASADAANATFLSFM